MAMIDRRFPGVLSLVVAVLALGSITLFAAPAHADTFDHVDNQRCLERAANRHNFTDFISGTSGWSRPQLFANGQVTIRPGQFFGVAIPVGDRVDYGNLGSFYQSDERDANGLLNDGSGPAENAPQEPGWPAPGIPKYSLFGQLNNDGHIFADFPSNGRGFNLQCLQYLGTESPFPTGPSPLWFGVNDDQPGDNRGGFRVTVTTFD